MIPTAIVYQTNNMKNTRCLRNWFGYLLVAMGISVFTGGCSVEVDKKEERPPNIVLIMADDLGYETISANGGQSYQTPRIDKMAEEGMRFEQCYAQPLCTPSRVQIMTGIYNVRNYVRFGLLHPSQTTFAHLLKEAGYVTCIIGKWQLGKQLDSPKKAGFDYHNLWQVTKGATDSTGRDTRFSQPELQVDGEIIRYDRSTYGPDVVSEYGLDFIRKSHDKNQPFFLYYPMILTHCPFSATPDSEEYLTDSLTVMKYKGKAPYFPDMMSYTDKIVGKIMDELDRLQIAENTLVIFTGDNGTDRPIQSIINDQIVAGAKNKTTDAGTRVPLIAYWPGKIKSGKVNSNLIDFSDFLPTLMDASGVSTEQLDLDGKSFYKQLISAEETGREWIYCWYSRNGEDEKRQVFARNEQFKLYEDGRFYEVPIDSLESRPMDTESLEGEHLRVYNQLFEVISEYDQRRLDAIPADQLNE